MGSNEIMEIVIPDDKDSICRFCLKISTDLIGINDYSKDIKWSKTGNLSKQLFSKLCLQIDSPECLPKKICDVCKTCLEEFFIFVDKIESNTEILRKVYAEDIFDSSENDDISNLSFKDHKEFFDSEEMENSSDNIIEYEHSYGQPIFSIENCEVNQFLDKFQKSNLFHSDDLSKNSNKNPRKSILISDESLSESSTIKVNEVTKHSPKGQNNMVLKPKIQWKLEEEPFCIKKCFLCNEKFSNDDLRALHYLEHVVKATEDTVSPRPFCSYCGILIDTKEELNEHIISKHKNEKDLNCVGCTIRFSNIDEMAKHIGKQHIENYEEEIHTETKCLICEEVFSDIDAVMKHSLEHISRRHTCLACKNVYISGAALNEHHRTHPQYKQKCPICKKWIRNRLERHFDSHNTVRNLECKICKKRYSSKSLFSYHMKNHSRPNFYCHHCTYRTKLYKDFKMHLRTHTNERPYKCTFENCGKTYKTNSSLSGHVKGHLNIKKFACEFCDYKSNRSISLTIHRRTHTGEKPYHCKFCDKNFSRQWGLTSHLRKLHNNIQLT